MIFLYKRLVIAGTLLFFSLLLFACDTTSSPVNSNNGSANSGQQSQSSTTVVNLTPQVVTPKVITPKGSNGSAGNGPLIISQPTPVPHGVPGSQQIVLPDRTLIINSVSKQTGASANSSYINLELVVQNTSNQAIANLATYFRLIGAEGDIFSYQSNSSDTFYGSIPAHTSRVGMIVFQIPTAAAANLHLFYRPNVTTESVIVALNVK